MSDQKSKSDTAGIASRLAAFALSGKFQAGKPHIDDLIEAFESQSDEHKETSGAPASDVGSGASGLAARLAAFAQSGKVQVGKQPLEDLIESYEAVNVATAKVQRPSVDAVGRAARLAAFAQSGKVTPDQSKSPDLVGTIESVRLFGEDWGLATLWTEDRQEIKLTGRVSDLKQGAMYSITAKIKSHPKYGKSYDVIAAKPYFLLNTEAVVGYIKTSFTGIDDDSARKYVANIVKSGGPEALSNLRDKLLNEPWSVDFSIIKKEGAFEGPGNDGGNDKTLQAYIQRDMATRMSGLPTKVVSLLADYLVIQVKNQEIADGVKAVDPVGVARAVLTKDPYTPIKTIPGYGFLFADSIGRSANIPRGAPVRLSALVSYAIKAKCETDGHCYLTLAQACECIGKMDPMIKPNTALDEALAAGTVEIDDEHGEVRIYPCELLRAELRLASKVSELCSDCEPLNRSSDKFGLAEQIQGAAKELGGAFKDGLDEKQVAALSGILTSRTRLHTITAAPGTGKTAVMQVLAKMLKRKKFHFCAPTGQGAKVLSNRVRNVGAFASTIHSMLKGGPEGGFAINSSDPLDGDILVIDEGTMPDVELADAVFDAVTNDMHVIVLGDIDQLPSIAPGCVLADLLKIEQVDHHRLDVVYRNNGGILEVIQEVKAGRLNPINRQGVQFSKTLPPAETGFSEIIKEYVAAVNRSGYDGTALLMSRRKGYIDEPGWNTTYANEALRKVVNPNAPRLPGTTLCVNDRIIIKKNMTISSPGKNEKGAIDPDAPEHEERVVNGDTGVIISYGINNGDSRNMGVSEIRLKLDDGRIIDFPGASSNHIQLGYAVTVHAAQGSEYADVIAVITPGVPTFINRNTVLTGFSRARTNLSVHGNDAELKKIVATPMPKRNSGLVQRVSAILGESETTIEGEHAANESVRDRRTA